MLEDIKHTGRKSIAYSIGNIFVKIVGFLLLPFYTTYLTVAEYGTLAIIESTILILLPLISLNMQQALVRFFHEKYPKNIILSNTLIFILLNSILLNLFLQPFSKKIAQLLFNNPHYGILISIMLINLVLNSLLTLVKNYYNANEKALKYSLTNILFYTLVFIFTIYFLVVKKIGLKGILLAQTLAFSTLLIIVSAEYLKNSFPIKISFGLGKKMLNYSSPVAFSQISSMVFSFGDRYVLNFIDNRHAVGLYSMAVKFVNLSDIAILQSFQQAYMPYAFKQNKKENFKELHSRLTTYLIFTLFFAGLGISLFAREILIIFSPKNPAYWQAAMYIPLIVFLKPLAGLRFMWGLGLHIAKKTRPIPLMVIFGATLNIGLNIVLIRLMNVYGAIISSFISFLIMDAIYYYFSMRTYKVKYELDRIIFLFLYSVPFLASFYLLKDINLFIGLGLKLIILLLYPLILWVTGFVRRDEKELVMGFIKKYKQRLKNRSQG